VQVTRIIGMSCAFLGLWLLGAVIGDSVRSPPSESWVMPLFGLALLVTFLCAILHVTVRPRPLVGWVTTCFSGVVAGVACGLAYNAAIGSGIVSTN